ncbi:MAG TPA: DUF6748 domain-containing protein [Labilithrix sp.]|nr:DUF6748 domain-containing protein [Labilithrix sp.]
MKLIATLLSACLLSFPLVGCVAPVDAQDDADEESEVVESTQEALTVAGSSPSNRNYFQVVSRDARKCAAPLCGGYFVRRVNKDFENTVCADGVARPECYVSGVNLSALGLSKRELADLRSDMETGGRVLVHGKMTKKKVKGKWVGRLVADEAWVGATGSESFGQFYRAADNGVRCVTAPCASTRATMLNQNGDFGSYDVTDVWLDYIANADPALVERAKREIGTKDGIVVAGGVAMAFCDKPGTDCGPWLHASEFYLRVRAREGKACGFWQGVECNVDQYCSWKPKDICGAADAPGKCAYKPEICPKIFQPVCACDGKTYGNACEAAAAGASVSSEGACPVNP